MSEETALAVKQNGSGSSIVTARARDLASRLKYMIVNGSKLADQEVFALAQYSAANELNPFAGESYYIPGTGPVPGIAGWRKKAQEQLDWEAAKENTQAHMWGEDRLATVDEVKHNPENGDIAVIYTLHDWLSNSRWRHAFFETIRELKAVGFDQQGAVDTAKAMVGPEPVWMGIGIVYGSESFGKSEKMSRYERAAKRAEKIALRKRFPRVNLPEPTGADVDTAEAIDVQYADKGPRPSEASLLGEMGFAPDSKPKEVLRYTPPDPAQDDEAYEQGGTVEPAAEGDWKALAEDQPGSFNPEPPKPAAPAPAAPPAAPKKPAEWNPTTLGAIAREFPGEVTNRIKNALAYSKAVDPSTPINEIVAWYRLYRTNRTEDNTPAEAAKIADDKLIANLSGEEAA